MSRRTSTRDIQQLRRRHLTVMRRHHKRGKRQEFRREIRPFLGAQS